MLFVAEKVVLFKSFVIMLVSWVSVNHAGIMDQVVVAVGPLKHCIGLIGHTVRLITTSDPIGLNWDHIGPHRTLSDHIGLKRTTSDV